MRPGRCFVPFSSAKTNLTRTTSPRLKLVIRGVLWVVPKVRQHRISAFVEGDQIGGRELVGKIVLQPRLDGLPHIVPNGLIALRRSDVNATSRFARNINAESRSTLWGGRHGFQNLDPHWHKYVNVSMCDHFLRFKRTSSVRTPRAGARSVETAPEMAGLEGAGLPSTASHTKIPAALRYALAVDCDSP